MYWASCTSAAASSGKLSSRICSSSMAMSSFSSLTSLMVTKGAPAPLAISTKSFQLSGFSSSSHRTVGRSSVINPGRRRMEWPSMNATMSSFREIKSSGGIWKPLLSQMPARRVRRGWEGNPEKCVKYAIVRFRSHDFFAGVRELSGTPNGQSIDRGQDDPGGEGCCGRGTGERGHPGRIVARGSHQRRSACHPRRLPGRHAPHWRQLCGNVQEGQAGAGQEIQGGFVRLSRDKLNKLAHVVADTLAETDECEFLDDRNTIRQEARKALEKVLTEEMKIDAAARQKIASQRKIIVEGSQEWDILYRKYYNDEVRKLGV